MATLVLTDPVNGQAFNPATISGNNTNLRNVLGALENSNFAANAGIALSKLQGYPNQGTKFAAGDNSWKPGLPATPSCRVVCSTTQSISNNTDTALTFSGSTEENFDTDTIHDPSTNPGRLTCKSAGYYLVTASLSWASGGPNTLRQLGIRKNGTDTIAREATVIGDSTLDTCTHQVSTVISLAINDYVEMMVLQKSGGALSTEVASAYGVAFGMYRIGT